MANESKRVEPTREPVAERKPFMSEGVREELERTGRAVDPLTGERLGDWSGIPTE